MLLFEPQDTSPRLVDVGVGAYRDDAGRVSLFCEGVLFVVSALRLLPVRAERRAAERAGGAASHRVRH